MVVHDHKHYVDIFGYDSKSRHKNVTTVDTAVAYDDFLTGDTSVLLINQAILIPSIKYILLCPMQCHLNGVSIKDVPKLLLKNPMVNDHVIIIPSDIDDSTLLFPLMLQGVTSYFPVQAEMMSEYKSDIIPKFQLAVEALAWYPSLSSNSLQEDSMLDLIHSPQIIGQSWIPLLSYHLSTHCTINPLLEYIDGW